MDWTTPKTNWESTDTFSATDWARITGNLKYVADALGIAYTPKSIANGDTLSSYDRNVVTDLIEDIYYITYSSWNRGFVIPRIDYGSTWGSKDLNVIEQTTLDFKRYLDGELNNDATRYCGELICGDTYSIGLI